MASVTLSVKLVTMVPDELRISTRMAGIGEPAWVLAG
jgi:hypothetical protein